MPARRSVAGVATARLVKEAALTSAPRRLFDDLVQRGRTLCLVGTQRLTPERQPSKVAARGCCGRESGVLTDRRSDYAANTPEARPRLRGDQGLNRARREVRRDREDARAGAHAAEAARAATRLPTVPLRARSLRLREPRDPPARAVANDEERCRRHRSCPEARGRARLPGRDRKS